MSNQSHPFTIELPAETYQQLESIKEKYQYKSIGSVMRVAFQNFDHQSFSSTKKETRQLSVRLNPEILEKLRETSERTGSSLGDIMREAVNTFIKGNHFPPETKNRKRKNDSRNDTKSTEEWDGDFFQI